MQPVAELPGGQNRGIVLGEVNPSFKHSDECHQLLLEGADHTRKRAAELLRGHLRLQKGLRVDEVMHGFSLGQIKTP